MSQLAGLQREEKLNFCWPGGSVAQECPSGGRAPGFMRADHVSECLRGGRASPSSPAPPMRLDATRRDGVGSGHVLAPRVGLNRSRRMQPRVQRPTAPRLMRCGRTSANCEESAAREGKKRSRRVAITSFPRRARMRSFIVLSLSDGFSHLLFASALDAGRSASLFLSPRRRDGSRIFERSPRGPGARERSIVDRAK